MTGTVSGTADLTPLWQPVTVGPVTVPNRIALSPVTTMWVTDGVLTDRHIAYYGERARGGVGLLIAEEHTADRQRQGFSRHVASALDERNLPLLAALADEVHGHGSVQFVQLYGPGILDQVTIDIDGWSPPLSPSGIPSAGFGEMPISLDAAHIVGIVGSFARAARNVEWAGLDGIELHSARSELLGQFLSPLYNRRSDEFGGSAEKRCQLALRVATAIREQAPRLAIGIQISVDEYMGPAALTPDLAAEQLAILTSSGLFDYVNLSTGNEFTDDVTIPPMESDEIPVAAMARRAMGLIEGKAKILVNGGVRDLPTAARLVRDGITDIVSMSRPIIADPDLVRKARDGRLHDVTPCLGHNDCLRSVMAQRPMTCLMNPTAGRERRWRTLSHPAPTATPRRVAVIGGGPAGMRAAITAADAGHQVVLLEQSDQPGGHLRLLAELPHRARWQLAIDWYASELLRSGVSVHTGVPVRADSTGPPELADADVVLVATGAHWDRTGFTPFRPDRDRAPGTDQPHVIDVATAIETTSGDPRALGGSVVVIDDSGDYEAAGLIDRLSAAGVQVDVVTKNAGPAARLFAGLDHAELYKRLSKQGVQVHGGRFLDSIEGHTVHSIEMWSGRPVQAGPADTIVLAMGRHSDTSLAGLGAALGVDVQVIGDALAPRETRSVVAEAHAVALAL